MGFADWTTLMGSWQLTTTKTYSGNSSLTMWNVAIIEHSTFLSTRVYVSMWVNVDTAYAGYLIGIGHQSYTSLSTVTTANVWELIEAWFWYDAGSNTRWGRLFRSGVQVGADTNCGAGAPGNGKVRLYSNSRQHYMDELEIWA